MQICFWQKRRKQAEIGNASSPLFLFTRTQGELKLFGRYKFGSIFYKSFMKHSTEHCRYDVFLVERSQITNQLCAKKILLNILYTTNFMELSQDLISFTTITTNNVKL